MLTPLVSSAPNSIRDYLIRRIFGLGQKRVLYSETAVTCHSFSGYERLLCLVGWPSSWLQCPLSHFPQNVT